MTATLELRATPQYFLGQMMADELAHYEELLRYAPEPTGSRLFCPSRAEQSDFDFYCLADREDAIHLIANGWTAGTSLTADFLEGGQEHLQFASIKRGRVNAIMIFDADLHKRFRVATGLCCMLGGPATKRERIAIFRAVLYCESPKGF